MSYSSYIFGVFGAFGIYFLGRGTDCKRTGTHIKGGMLRPPSPPPRFQKQILKYRIKFLSFGREDQKKYK